MLRPWTEKLQFFTVRYQDFVPKICHESVWLAFKQEIKQKKTLEGKNQSPSNPEGKFTSRNPSSNF